MKTQAQHKKEHVKKTPAKMLLSTKHCMCTICILYEGSKPVIALIFFWKQCTPTVLSHA